MLDEHPKLKEVMLDLESWLAKERRYNKEREGFLKTIKDVNEIVKVLKKEKFLGSSNSIIRR